MSEFESKYQGYVLRYHIDDGVWCCDELELRATQLKSLRALIDKGNLEKRRVNLPALRLMTDYYDRKEAKLEQVTITTLGHGAHNRDCWIKTKDGREKDYLNNMYEDTPEARAAIETWRQATAAVKAASKRADQLKEAIPRVKVPSIVAPTDASA
jgi:hypothetical protein